MKRIQLLSLIILSFFLRMESIAQEAVTDMATPASPQDTAESFYKAVEEMPEYPEGNEGLMKFLAKNIQYPPEAKDNDISGRVIVKFIVEKDGSLSNIEVVKSPSPDLSREAIRIVKILPAWKPGKINGKPVRVQFLLPIHFELR